MAAARLNRFVHVEDARFQGLLAGKGQHPLHELSAPLGRLVDLLDHRRDLRIGCDTGRGQLRHADDDGQDVVEVVGDPAGQLADGLHLLRLAQLLLQLDALRHVATDEEVLLVGLRPDTCPAERNDTTVLVDVTTVEVARELAAAREPHFVARILKIIGIEKLSGAAADHLMGSITEDGLAARAHLHEITPAVDHEYQVDGSVEDAPPKGALAPALLLLGIERPGEPGIQRARSDQQHQQNERCRKKAVNAAGIEAEIEAPTVEDGAESNIEDPGTHDDHEPKVDHGVPRPSP